MSRRFPLHAPWIRWGGLLILCFITELVFAGRSTPADAADGRPSVGQVFEELNFGSSRRLRYLKMRIGIKSRQSEEWSEYISALRAFRQAVRDEREAEVQNILGGFEQPVEANDVSASERRNQRVAAKAVLKSRFESLYATLDTSQRLIADATLTAGECGR